MNIITLIQNLIERVRSRLIPYKDIAAAEQIRTPLAPEMIQALGLWSDLYHNRAPWKEPGKVKSLNLCAMAAGEVARQVVLEMKVTIDAGGEDAEGRATVNARSEYLEGAFEGLLDVLRQKLEHWANCTRFTGVVWNVVMYSVIPVVLLLLSTACLVGDSYNPFIYFQF